MPEAIEKPEERSLDELLERFERSLRDIRDGRTSRIGSGDGSE